MKKRGSAQARVMRILVGNTRIRCDASDAGVKGEPEPAIFIVLAMVIAADHCVATQVFPSKKPRRTGHNPAL